MNALQTLAASRPVTTPPGRPVENDLHDGHERNDKKPEVDEATSVPHDKTKSHIVFYINHIVTS